MQCMNILHHNNTTQTHKFHKILKKPKNFQKPQNLGLKCMNAWKMKVLGHIPSDLILVEVENAMGREIWVREKCLEWEKSVFVKRKKRKWNLISCSTLK